jgi:4-hydroxy-3-methylbut-2-enyl diphosphate reductase
MKILLASPRGFCAGVNMAIETLETAIRIYGTPIYVFHEIVHNKHVVDRFTREGAVFVDTVQEVPEGAVLLFSAHGVAPEVRQVAAARRLRAIDATCPLVTKVHLEAIKYAKGGYRIMLIGHEGHDEVIGTIGQAPEAFTLVETAEDVDSLPFGPSDKLAYLTQTMLHGSSGGSRSGFHRSWVRRRTTSAMPPRIARRRFGCSPTTPTLCSCWAARIAPTASGWPNWPATAAFPPI